MLTGTLMPSGQHCWSCLPDQLLHEFQLIDLLSARDSWHSTTFCMKRCMYSESTLDSDASLYYGFSCTYFALRCLYSGVGLGQYGHHMLYLGV